jgi:hypothetical protein
MRFDIIVGNPPYIKNLHLRILSKCVDMADIVSFIHPGGWTMRRSNRAEESTIIDQLRRRTKRLTYINGHRFFGASFGSPLVITEVVKYNNGPFEVVYPNGNRYQVATYEDMPTGVWEPRSEIFALVEKVKSIAQQSSIVKIFGPYKGGSYLGQPSMVNNARDNVLSLVSTDYWVFFVHGSDIHSEKVANERGCYNLANDDEVVNLKSYLKTKVARFGLGINKVSFDLCTRRYLRNVPLPPLDRAWDDDSIMDFYGFSDEEKALLHSLIDDFY